MTYHVIVTEEDIKQGVQKDGALCPIACACKRIMDTDVVVDGEEVEPVEGFEKYVLTREARDFITNFDEGRSVQPFEFDMDEKEYDGD